MNTLPSRAQTPFFETIVTDPAAPWLTCVHGFSHNHRYFSAQAPAFQDSFRLCLIDLRAHGESAELPGPFGIEEYTDDVVAALDAAGIEKTHYWGTHTGAAVGLVLALRHPERLASLVLEGTFLPGFPMPRVGELLDQAKAIAGEQGLPAALADWFDNADWFAYLQKNAKPCRGEEYRQMVRDFQGAPWVSDLTPRPVTPAAEALARIRVPALVYNGAEDMADFLHAGAHLGACLPNAQCAVIPEAGGFPAWENPTAVNTLVQRFLASLPQAAD